MKDNKSVVNNSDWIIAKELNDISIREYGQSHDYFDISASQKIRIRKIWKEEKKNKGRVR